MFGFRGTGRGFATLYTKKTDIVSKAVEKENEIYKNNNVLEVDNDDASQILDITHGIQNLYNDQSFKDQADAINEYRMMAMHPACDSAIDDIINAAVSCDSEDAPVSLTILDCDLSKKTKTKILDEFNYILKLLNFNATAYEKFKQWYVDGKLVYQEVVDEKNPKKGIQKLVMLDPRAVKKVTEFERDVDIETQIEKIKDIRKYYLYDSSFAIDNNPDRNGRKRVAFQNSPQLIEMPEEYVLMVHSGIITNDNLLILSHLEKARKYLNNLKMMEDAMVIYRITRASEKRIFYIDVGTLPQNAANTYLAEQMNKHRSKLNYNASTGKVEGNQHQMAMLEDFWLPRREGGRGTEVRTLEAGDANNNISDIVLSQKNLYKALNVPISRLDNDESFVLGSRGSEISRDEWKFGKFINRLRRRFSDLFLIPLKQQLILKGITNEDDWETEILPMLKIHYASDMYMQEQKELDTLQNRLSVLAEATQFRGTYYSQDTIEREVLMRTEEEIANEKAKIKQEIEDGLYPDPALADMPPVDLGDDANTPTDPAMTGGNGFDENEFDNFKVDNNTDGI